MPESIHVNVGGVRLHVRQIGRGYPLVLLHGWPETSYCWRKLMPLLAPLFHVIAPDLRGFGDSDKPDGPYDKRTVANDILAIVRHLGYERVLLAGHDIGGRVAYRLTLDHPETIAGLVSMAGRYSPLGEDLIFSKEQALERWYYGFHHVDGLPEKLVSGRERIYLEHFYRHWSYDSSWLSDEDLDEYDRAYSTPGAMKGGFDHYRAALDIDPGQWEHDVGRTIDTPTLVLWGKDDPVSLLKLTNGFERVFMNLDVKVYSQCGHFIAEEKAADAGQDILRFAERLGVVRSEHNVSTES